MATKNVTVVSCSLDCASCGEIHSNTTLERNGGRCPKTGEPSFKATDEDAAKYEAFHGEGTYSPDMGPVHFCEHCKSPRVDDDENCCDARAEAARYDR